MCPLTERFLNLLGARWVLLGSEANSKSIALVLLLYW